jgi:hypothetical protein
MTVLLPKIRKEVQQEKQNIINNKIAYLVHKDRRLIKTFDGIEFNFNGLEFGGKFEDVFWGKQYIDLFIEEVVDRLVSKFIKEASENKLNVEEELRFLTDELKKMNTAIFDQMVRTEQLLLGKGYPKTIPKRDVSQKITNINNYVDKIVNMEIKKFQLGSGSHTVDDKTGRFYKVKTNVILKFFKMIWNDSVWSKVIATLLGGFIMYLFTRFSK